MDHDARLDDDALTAQAVAAEKAVSAWLRRRRCRSLDEEYAALPALLAEVPNALDSPTVRGYLKFAREEPGNPYVPATVHDLVARIYGRRPGAPGSSWERIVDRQQYDSYRRWRKLFGALPAVASPSVEATPGQYSYRRPTFRPTR